MSDAFLSTPAVRPHAAYRPLENCMRISRLRNSCASSMLKRTPSSGSVSVHCGAADLHADAVDLQEKVLRQQDRGVEIEHRAADRYMAQKRVVLGFRLQLAADDENAAGAFYGVMRIGSGRLAGSALCEMHDHRHRVPRDIQLLSPLPEGERRSAKKRRLNTAIVLASALPRSGRWPARMKRLQRASLIRLLAPPEPGRKWEDFLKFDKKILHWRRTDTSQALTERWPSGRRRSPAKGVYRKRYRGFESLLLRHPAPFGLRVADHLKPEGRRVSPEASAKGDGVLWYVYFLKLSNEDIYVGSTNDLKRRFVSHQNGYVTSTKSFRPVSLLSYLAVETEIVARSLERYFKSGSGKAFANKRLW